MKVLVTGGGGFLGAAICSRLVRNGIETLSYSRQEHASLVKLGVRQICGDICDQAALYQALDNVDCVFHVAAKVGVSGAAREFERINIEGTHNVLEACKQRGVSRLVFTSSPSVVFDGRDQDGLDESTSYPTKFLAHYPRTKAIAEDMVLTAARLGHIRAVALRPHLIWGPGDPHLVPNVLAAARKGRLALVGSGSKLVDTVYIDNAADAHVLAMQQLSAAEPVVQGRAFFVTNQEPWPMRRVINSILQAGGLPEVHKRVPSQVAYLLGAVNELVYHVGKLSGEPAMTRFVARQLATAHWYNPTAAQVLLGYRPRISMAQGFELLSAHLTSAT